MNHPTEPKTPFAVFTQGLRRQNGESMSDMARKLEIAPRFLSNVEHGHTDVPKTWYARFLASYELSVPQIKELKESIGESKLRYTFATEGASIAKRKAVAKFADAFATMDDAVAEKISALLDEASGQR